VLEAKAWPSGQGIATGEPAGYATEQIATNATLDIKNKENSLVSSSDKMSPIHMYMMVI
jgi:hypothetical protein